MLPGLTVNSLFYFLVQIARRPIFACTNTNQSTRLLQCVPYRTMADFETTIQQAVDAEEIPGCVLLATNRDGSLHDLYPLALAHTFRFLRVRQNIR
jgi:hypothetical protein